MTLPRRQQRTAPRRSDTPNWVSEFNHAWQTEKRKLAAATILLLVIAFCLLMWGSDGVVSGLKKFGNLVVQAYDSVDEEESLKTQPVGTRRTEQRTVRAQEQQRQQEEQRQEERRRLADAGRDEAHRRAAEAEEIAAQLERERTRAIYANAVNINEPLGAQRFRRAISGDSIERAKGKRAQFRILVGPPPAPTIGGISWHNQLINVIYDEQAGGVSIVVGFLLTGLADGWRWGSGGVFFVECDLAKAEI